MKTKYLFYALVCIISFGKIKAADLYVRDLGAGGAYATISEAIAAANDGDRIIIRPKTGNIPYLENLTINKSLTFASEINFSKYYVQGTISIVPAVNRVVTINNMYAFQSSIATSVVTLSGGRATLNIINCTVDQNIDLDNSKNVTANVSQSSCNDLYFVHGKITANSLRTLNLTNDAAPLATTDVQIIANSLYLSAEFTSVISLNTTSYPLKIFNNDAKVQGTNTITYINPVLAINSIKANSTNLIQNNRFITSHTVNSYDDTISISTVNSGIINIANNILINPSSYQYDYHIGASSAASATVIANNNFSTESLRSAGVDISSGNINGVYTMNLTTEVSTGAIINAGINDDEYQDLDLTRNDIGPLGGSNSWVNYWPSNAGNKPRVMFLNTPRKVYSGTTTIQAEATGISK
ncbi:hypothetical protein [Chryseobacterium sp. ERMR1:04]|uniref:hypothetical protein n=1 Tax=Chryseobacterium sp. ERMR1:04 TaxID=1705393 RepID=UPI0006C8376F|nr:hypothetical protein [Chryseobacterium sp. ERMR1:04]KPH12330.1 hypothetical protein AMQ68_15450 [Chryseobacterium sp. ERMR1:04]